MVREMTPQQMAALAIDRNVVVSAGAGSGKTWVLVQRYLKILENCPGIQPRNIVAITFTRKAAAEMRLRVRTEISNRLKSDQLTPKMRRRYASILDELPKAPITTIHGFATDILKEFAISAGLDPGFTVLEEDMLQSPAIQAVDYVEKNAEKLAPEAFSTALRFFDAATLRVILTELCQDNSALLALRKQVQTPLNVTELKRNEMRRFNAGEWLTILQSITLTGKKKIDNMREEILNILPKMARNSDSNEFCTALDQLTECLFTKSGSPRGIKQLGPLMPLVAALQKELSFLPALALLSQKGEDYARLALTALLPLADLARQELQSIRDRQAAVTFEDLEQLTWELLAGNEPDSLSLSRLRARFRYFMVDEFQDTNQRQWELIQALVSNSSGDLCRDRLFVVGDPKQSIYGFRGADVTVFNHVRQLIVSANLANNIVQHPAEVAPGDIHMDRNFRSRPAILSFTDAVCASIMIPGENFEVAYESLLPSRDLSDDFAHDSGEIGILAPSQTTETDANDSADDLPAGQWLDLMVAHLQKLHESDRFSWRDIALMYPSRNRLANIKSALRAAGIPFNVYKGIGFWQQPEVRDLVALVRWLADPGNRESLYTVLRSPMFSLSDDCLFTLSQTVKGFPSQSISSEHLQNLKHSDHNGLCQAVDILEQARDDAGIIPLAQILERVLIDSGAWGTYSVDDNTGLILANIEKLLQIVSDADREGVAPIWEVADSFVMREQLDSREGEAAASGSGDSVTLLTVHAAKGLEFPVVYLMDLEKQSRSSFGPLLTDGIRGAGIKFSRLNPEFSRYETWLYTQLSENQKKRQFAEKKRLIYVAFTRARDRLFLVHRPVRNKVLQPGSNNNRWLDWILEGIKEQPVPIISSIDESVEAVPIDKAVPEKNLLSKPVPALLQSLSLYQQLSNNQKPVPNSVFKTATTTIRDYVHDQDEYRKKHILNMVDYFRAPENKPDRVIAQELGNAYHRLLEQHPSLSAHAVESACIELHTAICTYPENQISNAIQRLRKMATRTRNWELFEEIRSGNGYQEVAFNIYLSTGIIHGVIDLLLSIQEKWHIIDYKTDSISDSQDRTVWLRRQKEEHALQMSIYALAVHRYAPKQKTVPVVLYFAETGDSIRYCFSESELILLEEKLVRIVEDMQLVRECPFPT